MRLLLSLLLLTMLCNVSQAETSLAQVQKTYVGRKAVLNLSTISCFHSVVDVIAIEPLAGTVNTPMVINAMGDSVPAYTPLTKVSLQVRCPGGAVEKAEILQETVAIALSLVSDAPSTHDVEQIRADLQALLGKTMYATPDVSFYPITASLADILAGASPFSEASSKPNIKISPKQPLIVKSYKLVDDARGPLLLLQLNSDSLGATLLAYSPFDANHRILRPITRGKLVPLPTGCWVPGEIRESVEVGDSDNSVTCHMGEPTKVNDYGAGGEQWIYQLSGDATQIVYVKNGRVVDTQRIAP